MTSFGLSLKCKAIADTVRLWRKRQSKLTRAIHASTAFNLNSDGEVDLTVVLRILNSNYPVLMSRHSARQVLSETDAFQWSEFSELSPLFNDFFAEANQLYFQGSLPKYQVSVMDSSIPLVPLTRTNAKPHEEEINHDLERLYLPYTSVPDHMIYWLFDFMAHIKTGQHFHGRRWRNEMQRLDELGAPVNIIVEVEED